HIGHAKSVCLNFGIAHEFGGTSNLRMDKTNPTKEDVEYVESIQEDVNWLISAWADQHLGLKPKGETPETRPVNGKPDFYLPAVIPNPSVPHTGPDKRLDRQTAREAIVAPAVEPFYASDYFEQIYEYAVVLIKKGLAY